MYAVVDIETTGGYAAGNSIIEISVHITDGAQVQESFTTLVNPHRRIPRYITGMTTITDAMVADAPSFEEIATRLYDLLHGTVFVAHNVNFDYSFVKSQLGACGYKLSAKKLCTVRLSKQIFPGYPSYSLGNICHSLGIPLQDQHRAGGDAESTVLLLHQLVATDEKGIISGHLNQRSREGTLPPHLPKSAIDALPAGPGVYYLHDASGKVVYVGKAKNIRSRVISHFTGTGEGRQRQNFGRHVHRISHQSTATELMASILESCEIKRLWPPFNTAQKKAEDVYGIYGYEDQHGYARLVIEKKRRHSNPLHTFHYLIDGQTLLRKLMREWELCPKLLFLQTDGGACAGIEEGHCHGACDRREPPTAYNHRVAEAVRTLKQRPSFAIIDQGLHCEERSFILVENGQFEGMGYLPEGLEPNTAADLKEYLTPYKENSYIRNLLNAQFAAGEGVRIFRNAAGGE